MVEGEPGMDSLQQRDQCDWSRTSQGTGAENECRWVTGSQIVEGLEILCKDTDFYPIGNGDMVWVHSHKMNKCRFELVSF